MVNEGVSTFIEVGPGKVLSGLIKRINKSVRMVNIGDAEAIKNVVFLKELWQHLGYEHN